MLSKINGVIRIPPPTVIRIAKYVVLDVLSRYGPDVTMKYIYNKHEIHKK